jgi:hypothetical protein
MRGKGNLLLVLGLPTMLCGCAVDTYVSYVPDFLKQVAPKLEVEQPPGVASIVRGNIAGIFMEASAPKNVTFSFPVPAKHGGWTTCIRASVYGATGRPMGMQTFLVDIDQGRVERREHVDESHWCVRETYQPL